MKSKTRHIAQLIKSNIHSIDPEAEIILYGSRARGDERSHSDWDILVLTGYTVDLSTERRFRNNLYELELETGERAGREAVTRATLNDINMTPIDGTFPTIERVVPDANSISGEVAAFNPLYLADIGKAAKILGSSVMDFHLGHNGGSPALVSFDPAAGAAFAVVMPYRCHVAPIVSSTVAAIIGRDAPAADEKAA